MYIILTNNTSLLNLAKSYGDNVIPIDSEDTMSDATSREENFEEKTNFSLNDSSLTKLLLSLGIQPQIKGFKYLKYILNRSLEDDSFGNNGITKQVYPEAAKKFSTTPSRVERAIRHAIEKGFDNAVCLSEYEKIFRYVEDVPTNSEFIETLKVYIKEELM